jgi:CubicO group peptidase (beta-lactamase class C family)
MSKPTFSNSKRAIASLLSIFLQGATLPAAANAGDSALATAGVKHSDTHIYAAQTSATAHLNASVEALLSQHKLPGLVLMVKHRNQLLHYQAYGQVNTEEPKPMEKNALFRIFSMSKPITAVALLQLVEQGKVSLDDDIRRYLPEFEHFEVDGQPQVVTVHHLLSHTAGFGYGGGISNWVDIRYLLANPLSRKNTLDDMVDNLSGIDLKFKPGERFEYSIASDIQGAIIEKVTGLSLDEYFQRHIFTPLNMQDTHFYVPQGKAHRLVDMYEYDASTFEEAYTFNQDKIQLVEQAKDSEYLHQPALLSGGGGLVSSAQDYSHFVSMLSNGGRFSGQQILSQELIDTMLSSKTQGLETHLFTQTVQGRRLWLRCRHSRNGDRASPAWRLLLGRHGWHAVLE